MHTVAAGSLLKRVAETMPKPPLPTAATNPRMKLPLLADADAAVEDSNETKSLVRLTMACNERCGFCNVPMEDYPERNPPLEELRVQVDALAASGAGTLTISGGEPTLLRKRLLELTRYGRAKGIRFVELQTNAVLIDDDYARDLAEAGVTSAFVSLLSDVSELHDELAGLEGAFPKCLRGIDAMLDAGIEVTLNPVFANSTESRVVDYVRFVAERLPRVRAISLSAVQPHGRASKTPELMPDYALLRDQVPSAREVAERADIRMLNPYCGLPVCVGWDDALDRCVEAIEAEARSGATFGTVRGVDNGGNNKRHGEPCRDCALRPICGGAWNAYWTVRNGSGLRAPIERRSPLRGAAEDVTDVAGQAVVTAATPTPEALRQLAESSAPTRWLWVSEIVTDDVAPLLESACTDLALTVRDDAHAEVVGRALGALGRAQGMMLPQAQIHACLGVVPGASFRATYRRLMAAFAPPVSEIFIPRPGGHPKWRRFAEAVSAEIGVPLRLQDEKSAVRAS